MGEHDSYLFQIITLIINHYKAILSPFICVFLLKQVEKSLVPDVISPEPVDGF